MVQVSYTLLGTDFSSGSGSTAYWLPPDAEAVQEWSDQEVYDRLESLSKQMRSQTVLTLTDLETVIFDPRFPRHLESLAQQLLTKIKNRKD